jgi:hypothetical protein
MLFAAIVPTETDAGLRYPAAHQNAVKLWATGLRVSNRSRW